jgi:hypothetical protein
LYVSADIKMDTFLNGSGLIEPPLDEQAQIAPDADDTQQFQGQTDDTYKQYLETEQNPASGQQ